VTAAQTSSRETRVEELSSDECRLMLSLSAIGRIAFVVDGLPIVLPVNYRLLNDETGMWILLRTRPGNTIDDAPDRVAFEIDGVDYDHQLGWSVLVRGIMHHLDHNEIELFTRRFDPRPWPGQDRSAWLAIKPQIVTGRRLTGSEPDWAFSPEGYR
jgi:nitroimidazol reductase NimA-like FMN-containing flavoprotein (pyridoxamine 5'-phosphate oxidase superfamily)